MSEGDREETVLCLPVFLGPGTSHLIFAESLTLALNIVLKKRVAVFLIFTPKIKSICEDPSFP